MTQRIDAKSGRIAPSVTGLRLLLSHRHAGVESGVPFTFSGVPAGATGISMNRVIIPPGARAEPHFHRGFETAIYLLQGRVETRYGHNLQHSVINVAGDFIFIPAGVPHQPINLSTSETAIAIVARNDPNEQESVQAYRLGI